MEVRNITIDKLIVSNVNVRKTLTCEEDETGIYDLANDIVTNGLINPITVRLYENDKYEIIAGQRRFLAFKQLKKTEIPCHIIDVSIQKAEEISLVENVQRNQMTTGDKVTSYSKLFDVYNGDIDKVISAIHISRPTIQKYLKIKNLSKEVLSLLDTTNENRITIDVAIELTKMRVNTNHLDVLQRITTLTNSQKIDAIKQFNLNSSNNIEDLDDIKEDIVIQHNNIKLLECPPPYIIDNENKHVRIPEHMYSEIIDLIRNKTGGLDYC